ncbi:hypothetical protein Daus18300_012092 [Diaporthe australafricana]|uniref:Uncharacterized protein n=1 Tax=Diaporthe australafricana TaxID=127596 RepID=A0ABR3W410_9PEZI
MIWKTGNGTIYSHAFGTLFAERAGHGDDGLFQSPAELQAQSKYVQEIGYEDSFAGETYQILVSGKLPMNPATLEGGDPVAKEDLFLEHRALLAVLNDVAMRLFH